MSLNIKKDEGICGEKECGKCGVPNPLNTNTAGQARKGFAITFSKSYQKGLVKIFGTDIAKKKAECEYNRVKKIVNEEYKGNATKPFQWKL